ncbi:shikimate dehydrogenase [Paradesulfitobacterium aromaticivorans]
MEKHFAVIGDPIEHSLSPVMHRAAFKAKGIVAEYQRFRVSPDNLGAAVSGLVALGIDGWNVTIPHKEKIIPFLHELTPEAARAGAVNTVKVNSGRLIGHNTDGLGFVRSIETEFLRTESIDPNTIGFNGKNAVILGAGGAAKGIAFALADRGTKLHILNRTEEKAHELAGLVRAQGGEATGGELLPGKWLGQADLVVQTTSVGLKGEKFLFSLDGINPKAFVVDIIFRPRETAFLCEAKARGCHTLNGLGMLLHQGVLAWEFWLEERAPLAEMWDALTKALVEG